MHGVCGATAGVTGRLGGVCSTSECTPGFRVSSVSRSTQRVGWGAVGFRSETVTTQAWHAARTDDGLNENDSDSCHANALPGRVGGPLPTGFQEPPGCDQLEVPGDKIPNLKGMTVTETSFCLELLFDLSKGLRSWRLGFRYPTQLRCHSHADTVALTAWARAQLSEVMPAQAQRWNVVETNF
jgi:hypothetical protein